MRMQLSGTDSLRAPDITRLRFVVLAVILLIFGIVGPRFSVAQAAGPNLRGDPALPDCGRPPVNKMPDARSISLAASPAADSTKWRCIPPYQTPQYTPPGNDSVALSTLLEAAGVPWMDNDNWMGVAAGHFCDATPKQLAIFTNFPSGGSKEVGLLAGPAPFYIAGAAQGLFPSNFDGNKRIGEWRAVTVGRLDNKSSDQIIAVRQIYKAGIADLAIGRIASNCIGTSIGTSDFVTANIADMRPENSDWVGVAVGNFDGTGKKRIAMLRTGIGKKNTQLVLVDSELNPPGILSHQDLDVDPWHRSAWKGLAAGNLNGGPEPDALVAVRQVSDLKSPTVLVYRLASDKTFHLYATSNFGNDGNSDWAGVAVGDFNADGRRSIVLVKNREPYFAAFDLPPTVAATPGVHELNQLALKDLDSAVGQNWTSIAAADWLGADRGADELIAVRSVHSPYRTNVFVYGNPFHLAARNSALDGTKAQYDQLSPDSQGPFIGGQQVGLANFDRLKQVMRGTHTNTFVWQLASTFDYTNLVTFLNATKDFGVDGKQVRVWVNLIHPSAVGSNNCSRPEDTRPTTTWNAMDYFASDFFSGQSPCSDMVTWAKVMGRLAQDFPHLVGVGIDDFVDSLNFGDPRGGDFTPDSIAQIESNLRSQAPWMSLIPTTYYDLATYHTPSFPWADIGLTFDTQLFYFRDQKQYDLQHTTPCGSSSCLMAVNGNPSDPEGYGVIQAGSWGCLAGPVAGYKTGPCADLTLPNALGEFADMARLLPAGRKMLGGVYFQGHSELGQPSAKYDYELTKMILSQPNFAGAVVYTLRIPAVAQALETCFDDPVSYENPWDKYCTVWKVFGDNP